MDEKTSSCGDGGEFARRTISCGSTSCSAPGSPRSRVKFLCSHGGRILPRPSDGQLKYVGGETRVISVPRDISFQEVMKRLTYLIDGDMILKYQLATEDLDALVSVKSEEDLHHMFDEMEHYQMMGCPRMRTFLFPLVKPTITNHLPLGSLSVTSSACTSPRSPDDNEPFTSQHYWQNNNINNNNNNSMHKIQSSPSICSLNSYMIQPQHVQMNNQYSHHPPPQHYYYNSPYRSPNPPPPPPYDNHNHRTAGLISMRSGGRFQPDSTPPSSYYYAPRDHNRGGSPGYCLKCMHHDNCSHFLDRQGTMP